MQDVAEIKAAIPQLAEKSKTQIEGKTYFSLTDTDFADFWKALDCVYTEYNLVQLFYSVPEIFAPIHAIANRVASAKYVVKRLKDDEVVYDNKYLNALLAQPNPLQTWDEFVYEAILWRYITGNNYIYANCPDTLKFSYENISTLINLYSYSVTAIHDERVKLWSATQMSDLVKGYRLNDGSPDVPAEKVLFLQFISLDKNDKKIRGKSPLLSTQKALVNLMAVYQARGKIYLSRGALGILVSKMTDAGGAVAMTADEKKQAVQDYTTNYGFGENQSPVAISGFPMDWLRIGMSIQELLPFEETQADAAAIYGVLDVPQDLMPTPKGATFENQKIANRALYQNVATPLAKKFALALTNFLKLKEVGLYIDASHDHIEVLQDNKKEMAEASKTLNESLLIQFRSGAITMNQWIAQIGGETVDTPIYNKRTLEMAADELAFVMSILNSKNTTNDVESGNNK